MVHPGTVTGSPDWKRRLGPSFQSSPRGVGPLREVITKGEMIEYYDISGLAERDLGV